MPLYEYLCSACDARFEVLVRTVSSDSRPSCPDCGAPEVRRAISLVAARPSQHGESGPVVAPSPNFGGGCCGGACGCGH